MKASDLHLDCGVICPLQGDLLQPEVSSNLNSFVIQAIQIARRHPQIEFDIEQDLDIHGLKKKAVREADRRFYEQQNPCFDEMAAAMPPETCSCELEDGRPRMAAIAVFVLLLLRGWLGGPKSANFQLMLKESITLRRFFDDLDAKIPGASTVVDNLNAVRNQTQQQILRYQLNDAREEGLDTFEDVVIDSTATSANSKYPTDSGLMAALSMRVTAFFDRLKKLKLGFPNWSGRKKAKQARQAAVEIEQHAKCIAMLSGKPQAETKRKAHYAKVFTRVGRLVRTFKVVLAMASKVIEKTPLPPSKAQAVQQQLIQAQEDLENIEKIGIYSRYRIFRGKSTAAKDKVYSISDEDAAIIMKGGWDNVFGYRPQLAFSGKGLVTGHCLPKGNAADSGQLSNILEENERNTGVVPKRVSLDDGYTNGKERQAYMDKHEGRVEVFSFAGAKGRQVIGDDVYDSEEYKEARAWRSAAESRIYTLKFNHGYHDVMRRGLEAGTSEHLSKVLAYNTRRVVWLREERKRAEKKIGLKKAA
jgi:hypothetical protein